MPSLEARSHASIPNGRLVDFDEAVLKESTMGGTRFLRVRGETAQDGLNVKLAPRIYSGVPDYWVIEVIAVPSRDVTERAFELSIPVMAVTGRCGIIVRGASREQQFPN